MEIVLEQDEIESLLREALDARGINVPAGARFHFRQNHKKRTQRGVFKVESRKWDHHAVDAETCGAQITPGSRGTNS